MKKSVLLIEDDKVLRESTKDFLEEEGFLVDEAENGLMGIQLALKNPHDIIVCDIMMPEFNGYEVFQALQQNVSTALVPFIFLTAISQKEDIRTGMQLGADDYITKPFDNQELLSSINTRINKAEKIREHHAKQFNVLMENQLSGVFVLVEGKIHFQNKMLAKVLQEQREDIVGKLFADFFAKKSLQDLEDRIQKCNNGLIENFQLELTLLKDPSVIIEIFAGNTTIEGKKAIIGSLVEKRINEKNTNSADNLGYTEIKEKLKLLIGKKDVTADVAMAIFDIIEDSSIVKEIEIPSYLTKREIEIIQLICLGLTSQEISEKLFISIRTVDTHRSNILLKTNCTNTAELAIYAIKNHIITV